MAPRPKQRGRETYLELEEANERRRPKQAVAAIH